MLSTGFLLFYVWKTHILLAAAAAVNDPPVVEANLAIQTRREIAVAVLAETFLEKGGNPYFVFHCNLSCQKHVSVSKLGNLRELLLSLGKKL